MIVGYKESRKKSKKALAGQGIATFCSKMQEYWNILKDKPQALAMIHDQRPMSACLLLVDEGRGLGRSSGGCCCFSKAARDFFVEAVQLVFAYRAILAIGFHKPLRGELLQT